LNNDRRFALCDDFHSLELRGGAGLLAGHAGSLAGIGSRRAVKNVGKMPTLPAGGPLHGLRPAAGASHD